VPDDEIAVANAGEMIAICEGEGGGQFTPTPTSPAVEVTPLPDGEAGGA
jgi:hypothetical protein